MSATAERMTTAEVLRKALELFGPEGEHWVNSLPTRVSDYCVVTACAEAQPTGSLGEVMAFIREATGFKNCYGLDKWNDAPERTWPEVKAAFEKAIELAEASR